MQHHTGIQQLSQEMQRCISECRECASTCLQTMQYCLSMGGKHAEADHIRTMRDCAEICQTAANFMLVQSPHHNLTCGVCAEVCHACAESCQLVDANDQTMKQCVEACRRCEQSCQKMAGTAVHSHGQMAA